MRKSIFFYKELTPAEVGKTGTHEVYVRLPNNFDYESFFGNSAVINGSVMEVNFTAQDITNGGSESIQLRFVYFKNSNQEKRIPSLGSLFKSHNVQEGDIVSLESRIDGTSISYYLCFYKKGEIQVNPAAIYFSQIENNQTKAARNESTTLSLQQIFYGAPGTGKSNTIKRTVDDQGKICYRTTFHPDSDYSTFVGAYKPSMDKSKIHATKAILDYEGMVDKFKEYIEATNNNITQASVLFGHDYHDSIVNMLENTSHRIPDLVTEAYKSGTTYDTNVRAGMRVYEDHPQTNTKQIVYQFVPQSFTKAYTAAWNTEEDVYLVIEEINRGNCAQIFGDLFQLLDRKDGVSEYPIDADSDLAGYIEGELKNSPRTDIPEDVKNGNKLMLPKNLYIWATMNTSDQSLFPIDSAFKRRWDWTYIPIKQHDEGYRIKIDAVTYDWWGFLEKINQVIGDTTSSEDKKLGYFFVKAEDKEIGADKFVSKVLFYLWNDVFKNYGFDNPIFSRGENKKFTFSDFFKKDGKPETSMVNQFLRKLDEIVDKENSFEKIPDVGDAPSSLMVNYNGNPIDGTSARNKYFELVKLVVAEKGGEEVANCIGAELTRTPAEGSTRMYKPIGDTGWYLATNNGIDAIKKNISKIKDALNVEIEVE